MEYVRRKAFSEPDSDRFDTLEDANRYLLAKCMTLNSREISNGTVPLEIFKEEQKHLLAHLPKFESCIYSDHRVDKYATVVVCQNHYSVPDTLVGKMVDVKLYTNKVKIYYNNTIVAEHERSYRPHDWIIDIRHYLRTLHKKPGALRGSTALLQADTRIKDIYKKYYSNDAKIFLQVLAIIYEKGVKSVENALSRLEMVSPLDMSADKVRVLCDHLQEQETVTASAFTDHLTQKAKSTLCSYDRLAQLQAQKTNMEAI